MTGKYLVLGSPKAHVTRAATAPHMVPEIETVWRQYLNGDLREIYQYDGGVVIILEAVSQAAAEGLVAELPLAQAGLIETRVIALQPFKMWDVLFANPVPA